MFAGQSAQPAALTLRDDQALVAGKIRAGIGGWTFAPWRETFYPKGLPHGQELAYASRHLTSIEINATFYRTQTPESFARWREEAPRGFVFALKAPRFITHRPVLADAGPAMEHFFRSGLVNLKEKLGPVNWQFAPSKRFDPADFEAFLKLLPGSIEGQRMRHAVEVRHKSFRTPEFVELLRAYKVAAIFTDKEGLPQIPDLTAPFVYARLQRISEKEASGYPEQALDQWAKRAAAWARGECPEGLDPVSAAQNAPPKARDGFIYFIDGFKPKAPAAAMALIARLKGEAPRKNG